MNYENVEIERFISSKIACGDTLSNKRIPQPFGTYAKEKEEEFYQKSNVVGVEIWNESIFFK